MSTPRASHDHTTLDATLEFLKRTRAELRQLRRVRVFKDRLHVIDINKDYFEVRGVGYTDADIVPILQNINTNFNPKTIHEPFSSDYKEFDAGRRYPWAADRVM